KLGIAHGQWEQHIDLDELENKNEEDNDESLEWIRTSAGSAVGLDEVKFLSIRYSRSSFVRFFPIFNLKDLDNAMITPFVNESFANKIKAIHIYSNGYKLQEIDPSDISIDKSEVDPKFPIKFDKKELKDQWVRIRPEKSSSY